MGLKKNIFFTSSLFLFILFSICSCYRKPEFSNTPGISFESVTKFTEINDGTLQQQDNIVIVVHFQDGDGNLGITSEESSQDNQPPAAPATFQQFLYEITDSNDTLRTLNPLYYNYYVNVFRQAGLDTFEEVEFPDPDFTYNGIFPPLFEEGKTNPLEGDLTYTIPIQKGGVIRENDVLKFDIYIKDRLGNESNHIETDTVRVLTFE